ncbi:protein [Lentinula edodes]|uniref:Protein n=1 Tax=Lentinula edodes TaxID=5353 RepID=A0A1Q3ED56_LENED|nr:protein [Lentinula edodes]
MKPCTPHYVLTLENTLCQGGHFYSSQTFLETGFTIFHTIVAADYLTNKPDAESRTDIHIILEYVRKKIILFEPEYLALLQKAGSHKTDSGSHVIPHLPNFSILEDIVGFFMLHNIALLGSVLDYRLYSEYEAGTQDVTESISPHQHDSYIQAKADALVIAEWVYSHFDISLTGKTTGGAGLRSLMEDWVVTQCKALILHKLNADSQMVKGETEAITPNRLRKAIEKQMAGLPWFVEK